MKPIFALLIAGALLGTYRLAASPPLSATQEAVRAAEAFLAALPAAERAKAERPFDLKTRKVWQFTPGDRAGVRMRDLDPAQRALADQLLRRSLSAQGYTKTQSIIALEDVLGGSYASDLYWVEVFGTPSNSQPWGWQFEGHHVVLTFTYADGKMSMTPAFLGAHPALVKGGKLDGTRVLAGEEDKALELFAALEPAQQARAKLAESVPADIFTGPGRDEFLRENLGLAGAELNAKQRSLLLELVALYVKNAPPAEASARLREVELTLAETRLAWFGPAEKGRRFYYRIQGPAVIIEFDHTAASRADDPHIHTIWRTPGSDYGADLLKQHHTAHRH